jgi:superfamily II DNA helicase RecQ
MSDFLDEWITSTGSRLGVLLSSSEEMKRIPSEIELACLVRQATWEAIDRGFSGPFRLPESTPWGNWPSISTFKRSNLVATQVGTHLQVTPEQWTPTWLTDEEQGDPFRLSFKMNPDVNKPRLDSTSPSDPVIRDLFENYRTPGQLEAIRAALGQPPGTTLTINLPTGTGKTLAILAPALSYPGTTIVVVPTTALAIDQEKRLQEILLKRGIKTERYAYHGELPKADQDEFRDSLKAGTKKIVFTSPEALIASLREPVRKLAEQGQLRALVIDEAHIIDEWGNGFRSEFQLASGMRRWLLKIQSERGIEQLRTILLTGTLTSSCLETLHTLYGEEGKHEVVASMGTRPEISYWIAETVDRDLRRKRLIELLANTAMPCLVYVTRRTEDMGGNPTENVQDLKSFIESSGFGRVAAIDGGSSTREKEDVIDAMSHSANSVPKIDITVANSAFGLGIDIEGLRTVIHMCVPETVERFYQEAGRAGRDGHYASHIWMPADQDWKLASRMAKKKTLLQETAQSRWNSMRANPKDKVDQSFSVDTRAIHQNKIKNGDTEKNIGWNNKTLTMMARAGMIKIEMLEPPKRSDDLSEEQYSVQLNDFIKSVRVRSIDLTKSGWKKFDTVRNRQTVADDLSINRVKELGKQTCMNTIFEEAFSIESFPDGVVATQSIKSQYACAGCPVCRKRKFTSQTYTPMGIQPARMLRTESSHQQSLLVLYKSDQNDLSDYLQRLLRQAAFAHYTHIIVDPHWKELLPEFWSAIWNSKQLWPQPDIFVDSVDLATKLGFVRNYSRPTVLLPSPDDTETISSLMSNPEQIDRSFILVTRNDLLLNNPRRLTKEIRHLRLENADDLDRIGTNS